MCVNEVARASWPGRVAVLAAALSGLALCAGSAPLGAQQPQRGAFVVMRGADTLAVERYQRTASSIEGTMMERVTGMRIGYRIPMTPAGAPAGIAIRVWRASAPDTAPPIQQGEIRFSGDTAIVTQMGLAQPLRIPVPAGTLPFINLSGISLEQIVRRARAGGLTSVPVLVNTNLVAVSFAALGAGSAVLGFAGTEMRLKLDAGGNVLSALVPSQGVRFLRAEDATLAPPPKPDYSAPAGAPYKAETVRVTGPAGTLVGTLTMPSRRGRIPAVVTITGSGLQDRDEALGFIAPGYRPFRQVADTLARRGIAVLRLDDRGYGESGGNPAAATSADFARDIEAAVAYLRSRPEIDPARIGLVGHSEGGVIAPMVAAADPRIRAIVLMAGTAYTGRKVLAYQFGYALQRDSALSGDALQPRVDRMLARMDSTPNPWMKYFFDYDPLTTAARVRTPVLVLQGELDRQVTAEQAEILGKAFRAAGDRDVTVRVFPGRNHLFLQDSTGDPANYPKLASYRVDSQVMGALADWLAVRLGSKSARAPAAR